MNSNHNGRNILLVIFALLLLAGTFTGGILVGWLIPAPTNVMTATTDEEKQALDTLFIPFWETWTYIHEQYIDQPVDDTKLLQGAIAGMLDSLGDKHTGYMNPEQYQEATTPLDGSYEGIGAYVDVTGKLLTIISPIPGSPAESAGLKSGDTVIKVNGEDVTGQDPSVVLKSVKGPSGSEVTLTIQRDEEEPFEVTIVREKIELSSVISEMRGDGIAYVALTTFGENSGAELQMALTELMDQNPKGLVFDLRYNSGGYLTTAIEVLSQFIADGVVMYEQQGNGEVLTFNAKPGGLATEIPLVVLVNEGSASASEITAGAIQDLNRGVIVGTQTYGKGSVQNWIPLENEQGAVRITIARWLTPNRRQISEIGLTPDVVVEITEEDFTAGKDPQLEKAVEILLQGE